MTPDTENYSCNLREDWIYYLYAVSHTQLLNTIQQKLIQRSPFSEPNSSYCVTRVISHSNCNKSELGHVAQTTN